MQQSLLIVGASARSAAQSACRAGLTTVAADCFADTDLVACCSAMRVNRYPGDLESIVGQSDAAAWMYTGALENYPKLVRRMQRLRPLWGNSADVLAQVRQPQQVARLLEQHGLASPRVLHADRAPACGSWLRKPLRSANGMHIHLYQDGQRQSGDDAESRRSGPASGGWYFQQYVDGVCHGAVFVAAPDQTMLLGVTRQLTGWPGGNMPFRYRGSMGPIPLDGGIVGQIEMIGRCLAEHFGLLGLFGIDLVIQDERVWTLEVNPRYTASVEILERAHSIDTLAYHVAACRDGVVPRLRIDRPLELWGKSILYAAQTLEFSSSSHELAAQLNAASSWPSFADLPAAGTIIQAGSPIATAFACGRNEPEVNQRLARLCQRMQSTFRPKTSD